MWTSKRRDVIGSTQLTSMTLLAVVALAATLPLQNFAEGIQASLAEKTNAAASATPSLSSNASAAEGGEATRQEPPLLKIALGKAPATEDTYDGHQERAMAVIMDEQGEMRASHAPKAVATRQCQQARQFGIRCKVGTVKTFRGDDDGVRVERSEFDFDGDGKADRVEVKAGRPYYSTEQVWIDTDGNGEFEEYEDRRDGINESTCSGNILQREGCRLFERIRSDGRWKSSDPERHATPCEGNWLARTACQTQRLGSDYFGTLVRGTKAFNAELALLAKDTVIGNVALLAPSKPDSIWASIRHPKEAAGKLKTGLFRSWVALTDGWQALLSGMPAEEVGASFARSAHALLPGAPVIAGAGQRSLGKEYMVERMVRGGRGATKERLDYIRAVVATLPQELIAELNRNGVRIVYDQGHRGYTAVQEELGLGSERAHYASWAHTVVLNDEYYLNVYTILHELGHAIDFGPSLIGLKISRDTKPIHWVANGKRSSGGDFSGGSGYLERKIEAYAESFAEHVLQSSRTQWWSDSTSPDSAKAYWKSNPLGLPEGWEAKTREAIEQLPGGSSAFGPDFSRSTLSAFADETSFEAKAKTVHLSRDRIEITEPDGEFSRTLKNGEIRKVPLYTRRTSFFSDDGNVALKVTETRWEEDGRLYTRVTHTDENGTTSERSLEETRFRADGSIETRSLGPRKQSIYRRSASGELIEKITDYLDEHGGTSHEVLDAQRSSVLTNNGQLSEFSTEIDGTHTNFDESGWSVSNQSTQARFYKYGVDDWEIRVRKDDSFQSVATYDGKTFYDGQGKQLSKKQALALKAKLEKKVEPYLNAARKRATKMSQRELNQKDFDRLRAILKRPMSETKGPSGGRLGGSVDGGKTPTSSQAARNVAR